MGKINFFNDPDWSILNIFNADYRKLKKAIRKKDISALINLLHNSNINSLCIVSIVDTFHLRGCVQNYDELRAVFGERGRIESDLGIKVFNRSLILNSDFKRVMTEFNPNWYSSLPSTTKQYIISSGNNPLLDKVFALLRSNNNIEFVKNMDIYIGMFIDSTGFTKELYDYFFQTIPYNFCSIIPKLKKDPNLQRNCNNLEINFLKQPEHILSHFRLVLYNRKKKRRFDREDLPLYFDGKELTSRFYLEAIFVTPEYTYKNIKKLKKHYNAIEIAFIKQYKGNISDAMEQELYLNDYNISEYFFIKNGQLMINKELFRKLFINIDWDVLEPLSLPDSVLIEYGLSSGEIMLFRYYCSLDESKKISLNETLKGSKEILDYDEKLVNEFISVFNMLYNKLSESNSPELYKFKSSIVIQLMNNDDPEFALESINTIFCKNNLPNVGKAFLVFKNLNPDYKKFFGADSMVSPVLKQTTTDSQKDSIIFSDLIRCALGSNNKSIKNYLLNIQLGNELFLKISSGELSLDLLDAQQMRVIGTFVSHLNTLYNNTQDGKKNPRRLSGNLKDDFDELKLLFSPTSRYDLRDRIVRMFCYYAGIKSFDEAVRYIEDKKEYGDKKGRANAEMIKNSSLILNKGDFVKGLGTDGIKYFSTILQNGSVAKDFLCIGASSDSTPLDTDLSRIIKTGSSISSTIQNTISSSYGPIWFVIKNDDRIAITRGEQTDNQNTYNSKIEAFRTGTKGNGQYGIRTGFASSEIDYIVIKHIQIDSILPQIKHEIALNGFYIPVVDDISGKLLYTPDEYDKLREKMRGLMYYGTKEYKFSNNLQFDPEIDTISSKIDENYQDTVEKRKKINIIVSKILSEFGLKLVDSFDYDISSGSAQFIDTGSTGRGTCTGKESDFDFILRIDSNINPKDLRQKLVDALNGKDDGGAKLAQGAIIEGIDEPIDIDISIVKKSETNFYSTDSAIKDRLEQIRQQDKRKYRLVIANIIYAKEFLKSKNVYKPSHAGGNGLGGVGVENWILQNGGSFYDAAKSFYDAAKNTSYEEFKKKYMIWDDGINYYTGKYDEFVSGNMTAKGYKIMVKALEEFLAKVKFEEKTSDNIPLQNIHEISVEEQQISTIALHDEQKTL